MYLSVNEKIKITDRVSRVTNVLNYKLAIKTKILVIVGEHEPKEWKELSVEYINWLNKNGVITKLYVAKALNHFTIVKSLSNPRSILTKKIFSMIDL